jgi:hypothetical protein
MKIRIDLPSCVADLCILMPAVELLLWIITRHYICRMQTVVIPF